MKQWPQKQWPQKQWYVVYTHAQSEHLAFEHLKRQGYDAYLPRHLKRRKHARKVDWVSAPLFPRYLFVRLDVERERWHAINSTVGVVSLFTQGMRPAAVPFGVIEDIQEREDEKGMVVLNTVDSFKKGDKIRVTAGGLYDQVGQFDCADDSERVVVLLNMLGREVRVHLPVATISACA